MPWGESGEDGDVKPAVPNVCVAGLDNIKAASEKRRGATSAGGIATVVGIEGGRWERLRS